MGNTKLTILFTLGLVLASTEAVAYYAQPFSWNSIRTEVLSDAVDLARYRKLQPPSDEDLYKFVLVDFEKRIPKEFRVPKALEGPFEFWLKVYTAYTTQHVVIFDQENPEIVYDVLDLRELAATSRNKIVFELLREKSIQKRLDNLRAAFKNLQFKKKSKNISNEVRSDMEKIQQLRRIHRVSGSLAQMSGRIYTQTGQRDNIVRGLTIGDTYFPHMEKIFDEVGLPSEITRLCLVESSFNHEAVSRLGAVGIWQFMERSAREYMRVDSDQGIDERLSPFKSTLAAAKLLKRNFRSLGLYSLAITAYNSGTRHLVQIPDRLSENEKLHIARKKLGWAGRNFYPAFLAVLHAEKYRDHFYGKFHAPALKEVAFIRLDRIQSLSDFAKAHSLSEQQLQKLNPDVLNEKTQLPRGFWITVPAQFSGQFSLDPHDWIQAQLLQKSRNLPES